jgi:Outer membrane protein beta-barrel domain
MKKLILSIAVMAVATLGANAQISFGAQAGGNLATLKSENTSGGTKTKETGKTKFGFVAGVVANIPFSSALSFRPEINFIQKGGKFSSSQTFFGITTVDVDDVTLNFVEMPLNVIYSLQAGPGRFSVGAGPNISFGMSGKDKWESVSSGGGFPTQTSSGSTKIKFDGKKAANLPASDNDIHFKALDFGANAVVGYKMDMGLFFNAGYTFGFSNLDPNPNSSLKTGGLTLKVGFLFGGKSSSKEED